MGAGKTTCALKLAKRLNYEYFDLDQEIEKESGKAVSQIFLTSGEDGFRSIETECLQNLCRKKDAVLALGGGTPIRKKNFELIQRSGLSVFLCPPVGMLWSRVKANIGKRPVLASLEEPRDVAFEELYKTRLDTYLKAHVHYNHCDTLLRDLPDLIKHLN